MGTAGKIRVPAVEFIAVPHSIGRRSRVGFAEKTLHTVCKAAAVWLIEDIAVSVTDRLTVNTVQINIDFTQSSGNQRGQVLPAGGGLQAEGVYQFIVTGIGQYGISQRAVIGHPAGSQIEGERHQCVELVLA